ncbi:MAG: hypothetical protein IPO65_17480 [Saprospiraceae bacterium]|nr:hypothetical protein [Saprospiraceae bacterium]
MVLLHLKKAPVEAHDIIASQLWRKREDVNQLVVLSALSVIVGYRTGNSLSMDARLLHLTEKTANLLYRNSFIRKLMHFAKCKQKS